MVIKKYAQREPCMAETGKSVVNNNISETFATTKGFSNSELDAIMEFKSKFLAHIRTNSNTAYYLSGCDPDRPLEEILPSNSDPLDPVFLANIEQYLFMQDIDAQGTLLDGPWFWEMIEKEIPSLLEEYEKLPEHVKIVYGAHDSLFNEDHILDPIYHTVPLAEEVLGTYVPDYEHELATEFSISSETGREYVNELEDIKASGVLKTDFNPGFIDKRTETALNELIDLRTKDLGIASEDVDNFILLVRVADYGARPLSKSLSDADAEKLQALNEAVIFRDLTNCLLGVGGRLLHVDGNPHDTKPDENYFLGVYVTEYLDLTDLMSKMPKHSKDEENSKEDAVQPSETCPQSGIEDEILEPLLDCGDCQDQNNEISEIFGNTNKDFGKTANDHFEVNKSDCVLQEPEVSQTLAVKLNLVLCSSV